MYEEAGRRQEGSGMERGQRVMERRKRMSLIEGLWEMTEEEDVVDKTTMRTRSLRTKFQGLNRVLERGNGQGQGQGQKQGKNLPQKLKWAQYCIALVSSP
jgi:hypothetical protein